MADATRFVSGVALLTASVVALSSAAAPAQSGQQTTVSAQVGAPVPAPAGASLDRAKHLFYAGDYAGAEDMAVALRRAQIDTLAGFELGTSALHFQIRRAMGDDKDQRRAFAQCAACPALLAVFSKDVADGRALALARLDRDPADIDAQFLLGKIDLNDVWLQLGTLGHRTGWHEYWEARHSMDTVLKARPDYVRAQVARAWIDYIVDTKVTLGFRWVLGGGDRKKALETMHRAALEPGDPFARTEAGFGLWEMEIREKNFPEAVTIAKVLARDYPENTELARFLAAHGS